MAKVADIYFKEHPWQIIEEGFDPAYSRVAESIFSLANEYMGVRGYMEEGYSGESLTGSYFNGIYEQKKQEGPHYVGITDVTEFMVNSVNWLDTGLEADGERLDLGRSRVRSFCRWLNMKTGLLTRQFIWCLADGKEIEVTFERVLSMKQVEYAAQRITLRPLDFRGKIYLTLGLDGSVIHESVKENLWNALGAVTDDGFLSLELETIHTAQRVNSAARITGEGLVQTGTCQEEKKVQLLFEAEAEPGKTFRAERTVCNLLCRNAAGEQEYRRQCAESRERLQKISFEQILADNTKWWSEIWEHCDIEIKGDPENQQGIRFCIFQLFQTYHGAVRGSNIGAKGLTGEAYNGNAFWDTETYCLPFFLFNDLEGARNLLYFRYQTLDEAKKRAKELDCKGAFYPIATISGKECCNLWQHASLQLQASTAVAYGIWFYEKMTGDLEFLASQGIEILIEVSRMLATRGDYSNDGLRFGYYGVMGPDEFQMMVNHNCYTNYMGRFTFRYTLECLERLQREAPEAYRSAAQKTGYQESEGAAWKQMADRMYIPYDADRMLYEQHEGFFDLPHIDIDAIPVTDFPLYNHWSYDRIYRNDMIKQPDVLMLMLLFNGSFTQEELERNYEYYEPRCIHESSLSPSVHSILATQLGKAEEAYDFFRFATRMDLDNYNRNSDEGIHTTSIAAAWMNIVYGFGGLRSDGEILKLNPVIPKEWEEYSFKLHYKGDILNIRVDREQIHLSAEHGKALELMIYGEKALTGKEALNVEIPDFWRIAGEG